VAHVPKAQIQRLDMELPDLQQFVSLEHIDEEVVLVVEILRSLLLEGQEGLEVLCGLSHIVHNNILSTSSCTEIITNVASFNQIGTQVSAPIPKLPSPTYTSTILTTTTLPNNNVTTCVGLSTRNLVHHYSCIPYSYINSTPNVIPPTSKPPITFQNATHTRSPSSFN